MIENLTIVVLFLSCFFHFKIYFFLKLTANWNNKEASLPKGNPLLGDISTGPAIAPITPQTQPPDAASSTSQQQQQQQKQPQSPVKQALPPAPVASISNPPPGFGSLLAGASYDNKKSKSPWPEKGKGHIFPCL